MDRSLLAGVRFASPAPTRSGDQKNPIQRLMRCGVFSDILLKTGTLSLCLSVSVSWAPQLLAAKRDPASSKKPNAPEPDVPARLIFADPFPSAYSKPENDLLLSGSSELKAQAMEWYTLGSVLEDRGDAAAALEFFKKSLARDPGHVALALRVSAHFVQGQQFGEAIQILKDAAGAVPEASAPWIELARIYLNGLRQPDHALTFAEKAYRLDPDHFPALAILIEVCSTARLNQRLEELLKKTEGSKSPEPNFWLSAGDQFRNAFALRSNQLSRSVLERINHLFQRAIEQAPTDPKVLERTADHFTLTRQFAEACGFYERANQLIRGLNRQLSSPQLCQKWAKALLLNDQTDACLEVLENLIQEQPTLASARELAGELYLQQGQLIAALGHLRIALDSDPSDLADHLRVAQLQIRLKRPSDAVETVRRARKLFPDSPNLSMLLAMALSQSHQLGEAVRAFEEAERQFQSHEREGLNASFYMTYGAAAERAGLLEKAAELLKKSIALDPEHAAEALNYLGYMWIDRNERLEEAGRLIEQALRLRPDHPAYLDSLGWYHYRKGDYAEAETWLRRSLKDIRREDAAEVYDHLGDVLEKLQRPSEASAAWEAAVEIDPGLPGPKAKLQRLPPRP
jgi:tetratricopeptide (TPR) repeat protein